MNGIYQIRRMEDVKPILDMGFDTTIADHGQEKQLIGNDINILVQINPDWPDIEKTVQKWDKFQRVVGFMLPDEPNMDRHMTPGLMLLTVQKIKKHSSKPICVCIANINSGRDYADWRRCGADVLFADIYPFKADPEHWYRKLWERSHGLGRLFRFLYAYWRVFEDSFRMRRAVKANYPQGTVAVLQCFGGKTDSGSDRKFYLPNERELAMLIRKWKSFGIKRFFTFVWDSEIHFNLRMNYKLGEVISREIKKGETK